MTLTPEQQNYKKISADEFMQILFGNNFEYRKARKDITESLNSNSETVIVIENIYVDEDIVIENRDKSYTTISFPIVLKSVLLNSLQLNKVIFNGSISFIDVVFRNIFLLNTVVCEELMTMQGSIFEGKFTIRFGEFKDGISINNSSYSSVAISTVEFTGELTIANSIFNNSFDIVAVRFKNGLSITGPETHFKGIILIASGTFRGCVIKGGIFDQPILIYGGVFEREFEIYGGEFNGLEIVGGEFNKYFEITGGSFETIVSIHGGTFNNILIKFDSLFIHTLMFSGNFTAKSIQLIQDNIGMAPNQGLIYLRFRNYQLLNNTYLYIANFKIHSIIFDRFINFSTVVFSIVGNRLLSSYTSTDIKSEKEKPPSLLSIYNSDLGKTTFIDCDFSAMDLRIQSSKITDIFVAGSKMPEHIVVTENNHQKRLGYGQLKKVYGNQGDNVTSLEYFSKEMNAYYEQISFKENFFEKLNLLFNRLSSNHGNSWGLALLTTVIVGIISYTLYCFSLGYTLASHITYQSLANLKKCLSYFLPYINPIHSYDFMLEQGQKLGNKARVIDSVSRIFISFCIYQLIQAFRKHGKK